ncbi:MAG: hypothetical protein ACHQHN_13190 [Sphingobacteriales bacterium]
MSVDEIKCPHCSKWSNRIGAIDERCPYCDQHFEPGRFRYAEEQKVMAQRSRQDGFMVIKKNDDPIVKILKEIANWVRWTTFYGISVIYIIIAFIVILYGLVMI